MLIQTQPQAQTLFEYVRKCELRTPGKRLVECKFVCEWFRYAGFYCTNIITEFKPLPDKIQTSADDILRLSLLAG